MKQTQRPLLQVLDEASINSLLNAPDLRTRRGRRDKALMSVMAYGGLRIAEACSLKYSDIQYRDEYIRLTFSGKGNKTRTVTLPPQAVSALESHLKGVQAGYIFPGRDGPLKPRMARDIVEQHARTAGLPDWVHPHTLRHSYATFLMRKTGDLFLVSRVLGHSNTVTTDKYYLSFDASYADKAAEAWAS